MKTSTLGFAVVTLLAAVLTGCSSGPSKDDAQAAVVAEYQRLLGAGGSVSHVSDFALANCEKSTSAEAPGFFCDVTGSVVVDIQGTSLTRSLKGRFRFAETDGGWQIFGNR